MKPFRIGLLLTAAIFWAGIVRAPSIAQATSCALTWKIVIPPTKPGTNYIYDAVAVAPNDIWAVGAADEGEPSNPDSESLTLHYNGIAWSVVNSPDGSTDPHTLRGVGAVSASDVWAVGSVNTGTGNTLAKHWNGANWSEVATPNGAQANSALYDVDGAASNDVWAVGITWADPFDGHWYPLLLHWNGADWSSVAVPLPSSDPAQLVRVVARSTNEVWVLGQQTHDGDEWITLLKWDGVKWTVAVQYSPPVGLFTAKDMLVLASNQIVVIANYAHLNGSTEWVSGTLIMRWDGAQWTGEALPSFTTAGIDGTAGSDVWVAGTMPHVSQKKPKTDGQQLHQVYHSDGTQWRMESTPLLARNGAFEHAVVLSATDVWLFGVTYGGDGTIPQFVHGTLPCEQAPVKTKLVAPEDEAMLKKRKPKFDWEDAENAHYYELSVRRDSGSGGEVIHAYLEGSEYKSIGMPKHATTFFWQVRPCNNAGCGSWTKKKQFTLK